MGDTENTMYILNYKFEDSEDESKYIDVPYGITKEVFWALRSPGYTQDMVARIWNESFSKMYSKTGVFIDEYGIVSDSDFMGLRPALWYKP